MVKVDVKQTDWQQYRDEIQTDQGERRMSKPALIPPELTEQRMTLYCCVSTPERGTSIAGGRSMRNTIIAACWKRWEGLVRLLR